ncbi:hypothetical protein JOQ06_000403, partial [Pogonophryne albipinna]
VVIEKFFCLKRKARTEGEKGNSNSFPAPRLPAMDDPRVLVQAAGHNYHSAGIDPLCIGSVDSSRSRSSIFILATKYIYNAVKEDHRCSMCSAVLSELCQIRCPCLPNCLIRIADVIVKPHGLTALPCG